MPLLLTPAMGEKFASGLFVLTLSHGHWFIEIKCDPELFLLVKRCLLICRYTCITRVGIFPLCSFHSFSSSAIGAAWYLARMSAHLFFLIVAKYVMMKNNPNTEQKISLDEHLFKTLRELGLVTSRAGFSQMCGKNDSYFDCMRSRGYGVHLGTLVFLVAKIANMMEDEPDVRERARLRSAVAAINEAIHVKCKLREQELMAR